MLDAVSRATGVGMCVRLAAFILVACVTPVIPDATAAAAADCTGDCDDDGRIEIGDLIVAVKVTLGTAALATCPSIACESGGSATVACLIGAVDSALHTGCPPPVFPRQPCGNTLCPLGMVCCNPLMDICTRPGDFCVQ